MDWAPTNSDEWVRQVELIALVGPGLAAYWCIAARSAPDDETAQTYAEKALEVAGGWPEH